MGNIKILLETTTDPISLIGRMAGVCWGADITNAEKNYKRGLDCIKANHGRTLEYVDIFAVIDEYSARVGREFYTHIGGAPTRLQASTRYIDYEGGFKFVVPPSVKRTASAEKVYNEAMAKILSSMQTLEALGIPREDCAMLLPLGMETKIVDRRNLRNLMDMSRQRMCNRAYWEYRILFKDYIDALANYSNEWNVIVNELKLFKPKCEELGYCPENKGCGKTFKER